MVKTAVRALIALLLFAALPWPGAAWAGEAEVVNVRVRTQTPGVYGFDVTLRHADEGWDHYADRWDVLAPDGTVLGTRVLLHPHVNEQPFTRSLSDVRIPTGIKTVTIRAHDTVHGWSPKTARADLPR